MQHGGAVPVYPLDVAGPQVREAKLPARVRDHDLPRVEVAGENQVEDAGDAADDPGEVAEQDPQICGRGGKLLRRRLPGCIRLGIDTDDLDEPRTKLELDGLVAEKRHAFERFDRVRVDALRERVTAVREVVVPEDDVAAADDTEKSLELTAFPNAARRGRP